MFKKTQKQTKYTPREQAKRITQGIDEPYHIGYMNNAVIDQEIFALLNLAVIRRDKKWFNRWNMIKKLAVERGIYSSLIQKHQRLNKIPQ